MINNTELLKAINHMTNYFGNDKRYGQLSELYSETIMRTNIVMTMPEFIDLLKIMNEQYKASRSIDVNKVFKMVRKGGKDIANVDSMVSQYKTLPVFFCRFIKQHCARHIYKKYKGDSNKQFDFEDIVDITTALKIMSESSKKIQKINENMYKQVFNKIYELFIGKYEGGDIVINGYLMYSNTADSLMEMEEIFQYMEGSQLIVDVPHVEVLKSIIGRYPGYLSHDNPFTDFEYTIELIKEIVLQNRLIFLKFIRNNPLECINKKQLFEVVSEAKKRNLIDQKEMAQILW